MLALATACGRAPAASVGAATLVHLDELLTSARVTSSHVPQAARAQQRWDFQDANVAFRSISSPQIPGLARVTVDRIDDGVRMALSEPGEEEHGRLLGGVAVDVPDGQSGQWTGVRVRARTQTRLFGIAAVSNVDGARDLPSAFAFFGGDPRTAPVFSDGSVQDYLLPLSDHREGSSEGATLEEEGATPKLRNLAVLISAPRPASLDVLSITLVAKGAEFMEDHGVRTITRDANTRRAIFAHTPATLTWDLRVPTNGRLDVGLTSAHGEIVTYRVIVRRGTNSPEVLLDQSVRSADAWQQHSIDLRKWAAADVELVLEATSTSAGAVALWGAPIICEFPAQGGARAKPESRNPRPNVIFYVIDGGGADLMSAFGYNRRTTPYLERLAEEGVLFENAHSNSTWTQPSTASFMTSLHHSVLGGLRRGVHSTPVPPKAITMAEHMHRAGFQTGVFTTNPNAARVIGLERGVDYMRDGETEDNSTSSRELHDRYWNWRREYPGQPYWVHFQTTDVHQPNHPTPPFAGLFVTPEDRARAENWDDALFQHGGDLFGTTSVADFYDRALEMAGIDRRAYFNVRRGLYDETMAHQDRELARLVEQLKADGSWEDTLLVIASDHGHPAGTFARFGRGLFDPSPKGWEGALFDSYSTRIPLLFVWPKRIVSGRRVEQPVSMIDVLPTILDLVGLPAADVAQGRSLAPLCLGRDLAPRPVIFDEFRVDEASGEMVGNIELIDGRWGASLEIGVSGSTADPMLGRHAVPAGGRWGAVHPFYPEAPRLLLYDLWSDPFAVRSVNAEHPDLVVRYAAQLNEFWSLHRGLAQRFTDAGGQELTPDVLKQLQSLGYIR